MSLGEEGRKFTPEISMGASTPQISSKTHQIPSNRDHKALNRGTFGGLGGDMPRISSWYDEEPKLRPIFLASQEGGFCIQDLSRAHQMIPI